MRPEMLKECAGIWLHVRVIHYHVILSKRFVLQEEAANNKPVPGPKLVAKAKELATEMNIDDFKCSAGWLNNFKRRHSLLKVAPGNSDTRADAELLASLREQMTPMLLAPEHAALMAAAVAGPGPSKKQKLDEAIAIAEQLNADKEAMAPHVSLFCKWKSKKQKSNLNVV